MAYIGQGDIVSGALYWWGLRPYSAATAGNNAIRITNAAQSVQQDVRSDAVTGLNLADIATWVTNSGGGTIYIAKLYDQTGNGFDGIQATNANQSVLTANVIGTFYGAVDTTGSNGYQTVGSLGAQAQPFTVGQSFAQSTNDSANNYTLSADGLAEHFGYRVSTSGQILLYTGGNLPLAAAGLNAFHGFIGMANSAASKIAVDGSVTTGLDVGNTTAWSGVLNASFSNNGSTTLEWGGCWAGDQTASASTLYTNSYNFWNSIAPSTATPPIGAASM